MPSGTGLLSRSSKNISVYVSLTDESGLVTDCELRGTSTLPADISVFAAGARMFVVLTKKYYLNTANSELAPVWLEIAGGPGDNLFSADLTQTANRVHDHVAFNQTFNNANKWTFDDGSGKITEIDVPAQTLTFTNSTDISSLSNTELYFTDGTDSVRTQMFTSDGVYASFTKNGSTFKDFAGDGSPEGVKTADTGSFYRDVTSGAPWYKTTDSSNTGWVKIGVNAWQLVSATATMKQNINYYISATGTYSLPNNADAGDTIEVISVNGTATIVNTFGTLNSMAGVTGSFVLSPYQRTIFINTGSNNWTVISSVESTITFTDQAFDTQIGTIKDLMSSLWTVTQGTLGISLTMPSGLPSNSTYLISVQNTGVSTFKMEGFDVEPGNTRVFVWNGSTWSTSVYDLGSVKAWITGKDYVVGDNVFIENRIYNCTTAHTSTVFNTDRANWSVLLGLPNGSVFTGSTYYYANDIVIVNNVQYSRKTSGTSGITFNVTEQQLWDAISVTGIIPDWATGRYYEIGQCVFNANSIWRCVVDHVATVTFTSAQMTNWVNISNYVDIEAWTASTAYPAGKLLTVGTRIVRRTANGTSLASFNDIEAALHTAVKLQDISTWVPLGYYYKGEMVKYNGKTLQRIASGASTAAFSITEAALWNFIENTLLSAWVAGETYYAGERILAGANNDIVLRNTTGTALGTFNATEGALYTLLVNNAKQTVYTGNVYYYAGDIVSQGTRLIKRTADGFSGATFDNTEAALWTLVSNETISAYIGSTYYYAGELVSQGTRVLYRSTSGISSATFTNTEAANWTLVSNEVVSTYSATNYYYAGEQVSTVNKIVQRITSGISGATFNAAEAANWTLVSSSLSTWTPTTYFYTNQRVLSPVTGAIMVGTGGLSGATFDATEVTNNGWQLVTNSGNVIPFATSLYFFVGGLMSSGGAIYRRSIAGVTGATLNAAELLNWILVSGNPNTTVGANYTVVETDDMINITTAALFTITIPAGRINSIIKFSTSSLGATPPTVTTSGGETIINPSTYAPVTSFAMPGITGSASSIQFQKVGTNWRFIA